MILILQIINIILLVLSIIGFFKLYKNANNVFDTLIEFVKNVSFRYRVIYTLNSIKKKTLFWVILMAIINLLFSIFVIIPMYSEIAIVIGITSIIYFIPFNAYIWFNAIKLNKFNKDLKEQIDNEITILNKFNKDLKEQIDN